MTIGRRGGWMYLGAAVVAALVSAGCGPRPVFSREPGPPHPQGTISGAVRGPGDSAPANHRTLRAVNTKTRKRYTTQTNNVGDYTFLLPPGVYRLEFSLRRGERLARQPDPVEVGPGDIKADVDLVLERPASSKPL